MWWLMCLTQSFPVQKAASSKTDDANESQGATLLVGGPFVP